VPKNFASCELDHRDLRAFWLTDGGLEDFLKWSRQMAQRDEHIQHRSFRGDHRHIFGEENNLNHQKDSTQRFLQTGGYLMRVRLVLPVAAIGLALITQGCQLAAHGSPSTQIRPAQVNETSTCDNLLQQVEARMSTALAFKVRSAAAGLAQAQELCNSGQPEQGMAILMRVRGSMNDNRTSASR
jgi:hypothetical protein